MVVYCVGCLLSMLMTGLALRVKHEKEGWRYKFAISFFASLPLMIIAALRYYVGQDYAAYVRVFNQAIAGLLCWLLLCSCSGILYTGRLFYSWVCLLNCTSSKIYGCRLLEEP